VIGLMKDDNEPPNRIQKKVFNGEGSIRRLK
jgi:hypothetical protein